MDLVQRLPGMRDTPEDAWQRSYITEASLRSLFARYGYTSVDTPVLEPTELFLRRSGGDLASWMYSFVEPGGHKASLRPEFTSSVVRRLLEESKAVALPWRVQYAGPVFRYDAESATPRQFTQVGAELFGSSHPAADAEVLDLAWQGLAHVGVTGHKLVLGDAGVFGGVCDELGLSERGRMFLLASLPLLRPSANGSGDGATQVREQAERLHLLKAEPAIAGLRSVVRRLNNNDARSLLREMYTDVDTGPWGARTPDEILDRLTRKLRGNDDSARIEQALAVAGQLVTVKGEPAKAVVQAEKLLQKHKLKADALTGLKRVLTLMGAHKGVPVSLDLGLTRGIAYYTGIVFEARSASGVALGGGGRFDSLASPSVARRMCRRSGLRTVWSTC